jgi:hypothetical protein
LAVAENIFLLQIPPRSTAFLQPVDQILAHLSFHFSKLATQNSFTKLGFLVKPENFPVLLSGAISAAWQKSIVKTAFSRTGMYIINYIIII